MKILVYDIPARIGGALSVLKELYAYACERKDIDWVFVINPMVIRLSIFNQNENVKIVAAEKTEDSWLQRVFFDNTKLKVLVSEEKPDLILSLANVTIPISGIPQ